ncbi:MAG: iron-containing alcohol dehydrogenase [Eubacteriales bacterium]
MNHFSFYNPVRVHFGEGAVSHLAAELCSYGANILLAYGGGSIKQSGVYEAVLGQLRSAGKRVVELSGIMPNPRTEKVYEGIELCRTEKIDFVLAVGGGSVIDCVKAIVIGALTEADFWETHYIRHVPPRAALPFGCVLTLPATGSEMNATSVISHWGEHRKLDFQHELMFPRFSILDPTYTYTMPKKQLVYGAVDTLSHLFEQYFSSPDDSCLSDDIAEALMKNYLENLRVALQTPRDYTARANLMWGSTLALNKLTSLSKETDWVSHQIEHALSAYYDIPHGAGLAIVHPLYLLYVCDKAPRKFARYARNVWGIDGGGMSELELAQAGIRRTRDFFREIGAPTTLGEVGIPADAIPTLAAHTKLLPGSYRKPITPADIERILTTCL